MISDDGEILTNAHVVTDAEATAASAASSRGRPRRSTSSSPTATRSQAEIVGFDPFADVALLKVDPDGLDLHPLELGSDADVKVGEPVAAIGSPFGEEQSLSVGVVSATDRSIQSLTDFGIDGAIQTDASINPGNSGGPLLDAEGEVVGINQQIETTSGGNEGVGFAVPIDLAKRSVEQLRDDGEVDLRLHRASPPSRSTRSSPTGSTSTPTPARWSSRSSTAARPTRPASAAGDETIRFQGQQVDAGGDVITAVNGEEIVDNADLPRIVSRLDPGDEVTLDVLRDGDEQQIELTLGERPTCGRRCRALRGRGAIPAARASGGPTRPQVARRLHPHRRQGLIEQIRELAEPLEGKRVLHVSATAFGGGVSEILYTIVPLMRDVGLDAHWQVIIGPRGVLQRHQADAQLAAGRPAVDLRPAVGGLRGLQPDERARASRATGTRSSSTTRSPPGLKATLGRASARHWIWRCHIDLSTPNPATIARLLPLITEYDATVWHLQQYVPAGLDGGVRKIVPAGDRPALARRTWRSRPRTPPSSASSSGSTPTGR